MKKYSIFSLVALFMFMTACGNNGASPTSTPGTGGSTATPAATPSDQQVTIRTSISEGEITAEELAQFEAEHPNIKIELEVVDDTLLAAQLATNSAPDVIRVSGAAIPTYVNRGIALDLTERIENSSLIDVDDLLPITDIYRFDGNTVGQGPRYGLPKDWSNDYAIFYNKEAFDAAGVPLPDTSEPLTWQEVIELAKELTIMDGNNVVQYGLSATEWGATVANFNFLRQYVLSAGENFNADDYESVDFDIPAVRDFIELWGDAVASNIGPNPVNNDTTSGGDLFLSGQSAMIINGYWYSGVIRSNVNTQTHLEDFGMLPTPIAPGGNRAAPSGSATGAIIYSQTAHPEEAWTFYEWFFAGPPAAERAASGWGLPVFESLLELLPMESEFDQQVYGVLQEEQQYGDQFLPTNPYLNDGWGIFDGQMQPYYFGRATVDDVIAGLNEEANVVITEVLLAQ